MNLHGSYFSLGGLNPIAALDRFANPYRHSRTVPLRGGELTVRWTRRAERRLRERGAPLPVQMQLYFACVLMKRVLFPEQRPEDGVEVDGRFLVSLSTVESDRCDPLTFAAHHPASRTLQSAGAARMRARLLQIDHRKGRWEGEFSV